ncbi:hypothetical protein B14911_20903 [Bacillus sp. NRRL B-14911]|nr:hypothetical protein B14911_20903 [Bacillus sp. NRRL B-14911]
MRKGRGLWPFFMAKRLAWQILVDFLSLPIYY